MEISFNDKRQSGFLIKHGVCSAGFIRFLLVALIPVILLWFFYSPPAPAAAQSAGEYFKIDYGSANLSQKEVSGGGVFYAAISGKVTCTKDLPMSVSEANITSRVVAKNTANGAVVMLNPSYTLTIKPFPSKAGEVREIKQSVSLQFPDTAESGDYNVVAELIEAKVRVLIWVGVTEYLPQTQAFGSVKYVSPVINPAQLPPPAAPPPTTPPAAVSPSAPTMPPSIPETVASPAVRASGFAWWMWVIVVIAVVTAVVNIALILRRRA